MINISLCSPRASSGIVTKQAALIQSTVDTPIPDHHVLLKVDRFGFSANNVTYQVLGEHPHFRYFDFHPTPSSSQTKYGLVPVWGFATVVLSSHPAIPVGERVYGYLAPARYLLVPVSPTDFNKYAFYVPRPHLPSDRRPYNQILRCSADPQYTPDTEDFTMLYRPLFWTSYWCEDWLYSSKYRGSVTRILISSASSKTAFCLAYLINKRRRNENLRVRITGITSSRNIRFTRDLGLYDDVVDYDKFELTGSASERWLYVDVAGNKDFNSRLNGWFGSPYTPRLAASISLGLSNLTPDEAASVSWSSNAFNQTDAASSGDTSQFWPLVEPFFMPEWLDVRRKEMSVKEITRQQAQAWADLMVDCLSWVEIRRVNGAEQVKKSYEEMVGNRTSPDTGYIWSLWEENSGLITSKL